jgi:hypothetical protein
MAVAVAVRRIEVLQRFDGMLAVIVSSSPLAQPHSMFIPIVHVLG